MPRFRLNALLAAVASLTPLLLAAPVAAADVRLTILHTNDTHGHLLPFSYPETFDKGSELSMLTYRRNVGGIARRATLAATVRAEKGHQTLLLDAGDICDGTPFSTVYHGEADVAAMNAAGYDYGCPGNHELSNSLAQLRKLKGQARYPILCANLVNKGDQQPIFASSVLRQVGESTVAVFGLLTTDARTYPAAKTELDVLDPFETAARLVPELRKSADVVILLSHLGEDVDRVLAAKVPGIDVIVGGHSHTLLRRPEFIPNAASPIEMGLKGTVIVQDFQWGTTLGCLDLRLKDAPNGRHKLASYSGRLLPVTTAEVDDPATQRTLAAYWDPIAPEYGAVLGEAKGDFTALRDDYAEYNLMCDAVLSGTGAAFDIENVGGVRAPLVRGPVTYADAIVMDPFGNTVVRIKVTGRALKQILTAAQPAVAGIRYAVRGNQLLSATLAGKPIEDDTVYEGVTNSFFASQPALAGVIERTETGLKRLDLLVGYIRTHSPITPAYDGRRKITQPSN